VRALRRVGFPGIARFGQRGPHEQDGQGAGRGQPDEADRIAEMVGDEPRGERTQRRADACRGARARFSGRCLQL